MRSLNVFPTVIHTADAAGADEWTGALVDDIRRWRAESPESIGRSERGGAWHSPLNGMRRPAFRPLVDAVLALATDAFRAGRYAGGSVARLKSMWANVLPPGAHHAVHSHLPSLWSGVYYARLPAGASRITFVDPRPAAEAARPRLAPGVDPGVGVTGIDVHEGMLLLFPGWLQHYVEPNPGPGDRVAVSFNVVQI